jgi:hypothetical protein
MLTCATVRDCHRPGAYRGPCDLQVQWGVEEATAVYRPRHPERSSFYRILERCFDNYVGRYDERFESHSGPLRPVVTRTVGAFLDCGRLFNGFVRIRCPSCGREHLPTFSCQTRNFCPSCQSDR